MAMEKRIFISLKWIFAISVGALLSVLTLASGRIIIEKEREVLEAETQRRLLAQCRNLASLSSSPLLDEFPEFVLHPLLKDILEENAELAHAVVVDREGRIRGDADLRRIDQPFEDRPGLSLLAVDLPKESRETFRHDEEILKVSVPVLYRDGALLGTVHLGMRKDHVRRAIADAQKNTFQVVLGALAIGLVFTIFLTSRIVRPINQLTRGTEEIGRGNLDYRIEVKSRTEVGRLARTFNEMTARLKEAQKAMIERERLNRDLEIAHEIEEKLLPRPNLEVPGYDVAGFHRSARVVGGDYYDLIPIDEEHVGITVADVAGKGIPGLVVMAMTSALLRSHAPRYRSPAEMLTVLNAMLLPNMRRGMFITMFYGILHLPTGRFVFAGAGHNPLVHFRADTGLQSLVGTKGIPLGLYSEGRFAERIANQSIVLQPGDGFLQYTDGVSEATNPALEEFGIDGLLSVARRECGHGSREIVEAILEEVRRFSEGAPAADDLTILAVKRAGGARARARAAREGASSR
ncbi:MAG: SpoIIE family protein phosphatase [Candidatus Eisenbacteria bacterium]|nr:SpoIIE family protein phosphatase [Candidatus Eisenbacteria bacterium]